MNFADAAKTGLPFRRKEWKHWIIYNNDTVSYQWDHGGLITHDMRPEWFEADDWEADWPKIEIDKGKYWQAAAETLQENSNLFMGKPGEFDIQKFLTALAVKLGLD